MAFGTMFSAKLGVIAVALAALPLECSGSFKLTDQS